MPKSKDCSEEGQPQDRSLSGAAQNKINTTPTIAVSEPSVARELVLQL